MFTTRLGTCGGHTSCGSFWRAPAWVILAPMVCRPRLAVLVAVVAQVLLIPQSHGQVPTVSEIQVQLDAHQVMRHEGTVDSVLSGYEDAQEWLEWSIIYQEALLALISGRVESFHERLRALEALDLPSGPGPSLRLAELYSLAVELEVPSIDEVRFANAIATVRRTIRHLTSMHGPSPSFDDPERLRMRANFLYRAGRLAELRRLRQLQTEDLGNGEHVLVEGYIALLIAKLEQTKKSAEAVIDHLQPLVDEAEGGFDDQEMGLMSLYLGAAYMMLASDPKSYERQANVEEAARFAASARRRLELLDVPILWSLAMALTGDVLAMQHDLAAPNMDKQRTLALRRDRAYYLSSQYH